MSFTPSSTLRAIHGKSSRSLPALPADWAPKSSPCAVCGTDTIHSITTLYGPRLKPVVICRSCKSDPAVNLVAVIEAAK